MSLQQIKGIGAVIETILKKNGIFDAKALSIMTPKTLSSLDGISLKLAEKIIKESQQFVPTEMRTAELVHMEEEEVEVKKPKKKKVVKRVPKTSISGDHGAPLLTSVQKIQQKLVKVAPEEHRIALDQDKEYFQEQVSEFDLGILP